MSISELRVADAQNLPSEAQALMQALFDEHDNFLRRMGSLLCGQSALADDLVQETWLRAWRSLHHLREVKAARGWLMTIMRRELARYMSRPWQETQTFGESDHEQATACGADTAVLIDQLLAQLNSEEQQLLQACVIDGLSYAETAELLKVAPDTVGVRLHRLRRKMVKVAEVMEEPENSAGSKIS